MAIDLLSDGLNTIKICERVGKTECDVKASKLIADVLEVLKAHGYISEYSQKDNGKGGLLNVQLNGKISELRSVKPRFAVSNKEWVATETHYLPSYNLGLLIVSTPKGVMSNKEAKEAKLGGRLLAFVY
jgi:small subunit ribosomal protein S8